MRQDKLDHVASPQLGAGAQWRTAAACKSADPDLFFPVSASPNNPQQVADAKAICACCLVRHECLAFALRTRQLHGIWGGMTEEERYPLVKADHRAGSARMRRKAL
jgi:WhiB family transcriptional regulator, redox-sensing transcriptional regulator